MAGIKITDLTALSVAESGDYLCIVDVSDTSASAAGTTKKIELGNVVESGTFTPTFSSPTGAASNPTLISALYVKVGNIVTCTIQGQVDLDFSSLNSGDITTTFPVNTVTPNSTGVVTFNDVYNINGFINGGFKIRFSSGDTSINDNVSFYAVFQYEVN